jgi:hypothetical protein
VTLQHLRPSTLRALADAIEYRRQGPERLCAADLTDEGVERLGDMLMKGNQPTVGFWRKYRRPTDA